MGRVKSYYHNERTQYGIFKADGITGRMSPEPTISKPIIDKERTIMIGEVAVTVECEICRKQMPSTQAQVLDYSYVAVCSDKCRTKMEAHIQIVLTRIEQIREQIINIYGCKDIFTPASTLTGTIIGGGENEDLQDLAANLEDTFDINLDDEYKRWLTVKDVIDSVERLL